MVHDPDYVNGILMGVRENGFGNTSPALAKSFLYTCGSLVDAATAALNQGITCSPTSGFHHAHYSESAGFCTFNGLVLTASKLMRDCGLPRIAIIDADYHVGNGTNDILARIGELRNGILHYSFGYHFHNKSQALQYLDRARGIATDLGTFQPSLIIYQAGADVHVNDPLGGVLTSQQLRERDRTVFGIAKQLRIPLVWNLAGGYQEDEGGTINPVLRIHLSTFEEALLIHNRTEQVND